VPIVTPINKKKTNRQLIFFQILGTIKKLAIISKVKIIGTISLGGKMNESKEILEAENPKPLKPLTNDAKSITIQKNRKFVALRFIVSKYSINRVNLSLIILYLKLIKVILSFKLIGILQIMHNKSSNRSFGILFFIVFLIIGLWPLLNENEIRIWSISIGIIFLVLGLLNSNLLSPLNNLWVKLGEVLGKIIAPIIMFLIFMLVVTPTAILVRLFRKDLLSLKMDKKIKSYWIERKKNLGSMKNQF
tara:strand:- start:1113 stop:1853 length:741 start_codon:yes stop_codon:yes gene_type:complete